MRSLYSCLTLLVLSAVCSAFPSHSPSACSCTYGTVPVDVDVDVAVDPSNASSTATRHIHATWDIFGYYCQPTNGGVATDTVQLLLHGSTYSSQYWFWQLDGYEQYSYVNHACEQGHAVFAYDGPGVGRSFRPQSSTDIQLQSMGYVAVSLAKMLKTGQLTLSLGLLPRLFSHVVAIGHSQGSVMFCYVAIAYTNAKPALKNPFDGLILTGHIHDTVFYTLSLHGKAIANQANPARWGSLDDGYVTTPAGQRNVFYPPDADMFDPNVLELDEITKDISSGSIARGLTYHPAPAYRGPVVELIGSKDQQHCTDANGVVIECVQSTLQVSEAPYWPASTNFTVVVRPGSGHDVNMDFGAPGTFDIITGIVNAWDRSHFH